jgi:hypothetical protein
MFAVLVLDYLGRRLDSSLPSYCQDRKTSRPYVSLALLAVMMLA